MKSFIPQGQNTLKEAESRGDRQEGALNKAVIWGLVLKFYLGVLHPGAGEMFPPSHNVAHMPDCTGPNLFTHSSLPFLNSALQSGGVDLERRMLHILHIQCLKDKITPSISHTFEDFKTSCRKSRMAKLKSFFNYK